MIFPQCASFYESNQPDAGTSGFIVCHNYKSKFVSIKSKPLESVWFDTLLGKTKRINYAVLGKKVSVFLDFERNTGMERITMEEGTTHDLLKEAKAPQPGAPPAELRPKFVKVTCNPAALEEMKANRKGEKPQVVVNPIPTKASRTNDNKSLGKPAITGITRLDDNPDPKSGTVSSITSISASSDEEAEAPEKKVEEEKEDEDEEDEAVISSVKASSGSKSTSSQEEEEEEN